MSQKLPRIVLLGPPGVGKGTQASRLSDVLGIPHINVGNILRQEVSEKTQVGTMIANQMATGNLVPEDVVIKITCDKLRAFDDMSGFILDGFPRTIFQAESLQESDIRIDIVISITSPDEVIIERMTGRRTCVGCGEAYHIKFNPSVTITTCQICGKDLVQRIDDKPQTVINRLGVYHTKTEPLIDFYQKKNMHYEMNGAQLIDNVFAGLHAIVRDL